MPIFLAPLWIFALSLSDFGATAVGLLWLLGRVVYAAGYGRAAEKRLPGLFIQSSPATCSFLGAATVLEEARARV
jgi:glutathione S-transferase